MNFAPQTALKCTVILPTLRKFCILLHCQASQTEISKQNQGRSIVINPSVCASVCMQAYLWNRWTDLHAILCADPLWPWLGPSPAALRYVMYFRFYGCHV